MAFNLQTMTLEEAKIREMDQNQIVIEQVEQEETPKKTQNLTIIQRLKLRGMRSHFVQGKILNPKKPGMLVY